jgi:hypothetical protein
VTKPAIKMSPRAEKETAPISIPPRKKLIRAAVGVNQMLSINSLLLSTDNHKTVNNISDRKKIMYKNNRHRKKTVQNYTPNQGVSIKAAFRLLVYALLMFLANTLLTQR